MLNSFEGQNSPSPGQPIFKLPISGVGNHSTVALHQDAAADNRDRRPVRPLRYSVEGAEVLLECSVIRVKPDYSYQIGLEGVDDLDMR